jgi:hypothetical protein
MKWKKPSGIIIETNEDDATIDKCVSLDWEPIEDSEGNAIIPEPEDTDADGQDNPPDVEAETHEITQDEMPSQGELL